MKTTKTISMAKTAIFLLLCGLIVCWAFQVSAEEWTDAQKDVWKSVQGIWEAAKKGDADAIVAIAHDDAVIWWWNNTSPHKKGLLKDAYQNWFTYDVPVSFDLHPFNIQIFDNVAIVAYYYNWKGNRLFREGRKLETWLNQDNRWVIIGTLDSLCDKPPTCASY
jgi:ketosteroid isomerase-like protein